MKQIVRFAGIGAVAAVMVVGPAVAPASAATSSIAFAGPVIAGGGGAATVPIVYTCTSDPGQNHLFVAVKQGPGLPENSSTETNPDLTAFYSTNWKSDSGVNALRCDGTSHKQTIVLKNQPGFTPLSNLVAGPALLQLCMFDAAAPDGTFSYTMQTVTAGAGR